MPCSVPFLSCSRPVFFSCTTFPLLLRIAVYTDYVFLNMPSKWSLQMAPGTKFLRLLGSLCARAHLENQQEPSDTDKISFKKKTFKCIWKPRMYGETLEIYIDWLTSCYSGGFAKPTQTKLFPQNCEEISPIVNCEEPQGNPRTMLLLLPLRKGYRNLGGRGPFGCIAPGARWWRKYTIDAVGRRGVARGVLSLWFQGGEEGGKGNTSLTLSDARVYTL